MKTLLSQFCEEFDGVVRPLLQPLTQAADTLNHVSDKTGVRSLLPTVLDVRHHLSTLADKVAEQQAYVLIFGPLKSGKSTLMNAISAAYVSEVTALPAYPCMVYVSHAEKVSFTVTRYNGQQEEFGDMASMRTLLEWAHNELADRIREVEARNEVFDPNEHIPQAIRRIDVRLPAEHLEESSAALVDTPGLYSRMKFGYDRMTREFRNTASSAIFVVKTDNLFLEQVFDEFGDLLNIFSRIFLVVNIDSTKRDLQPDGTLVPSLESNDPDRIISAFENLSMTAPLKAALKEGRLKIYPVDLLQAASGRVSDKTKLGTAATTSGVSADGGAAFKSFQNDLTDYLNSTDYLVAFLGDSLKQAWGLLGELRNLVERDSVRELGQKVGRLQGEKDRLEGMEQAVERLNACDWDSFFSALGDDLGSIARGRIEKLRDQTAHGLGDAMDSWFESDSSYQSLLNDLAQPLLARSREDLTATARGVLETVASTETAGAQVPEKIRQDLESLGLDLGSLGKICLKQIDPGSGMAHANLDVPTSRIPVKKGFLDYVCLRGQGSVRRRLFGPEEAPNQPIPKSVKHRRLGTVGRDAVQDALEAAFGSFFEGALDHLSTQVLKLYVGTLRMGIKAELRKIKEGNALRKASVDRRLAELTRVSESLDSLGQVVSKASVVLGSLSNRYGETDPTLLSRPTLAGAPAVTTSSSASKTTTTIPSRSPAPAVAGKAIEKAKPMPGGPKSPNQPVTSSMSATGAGAGTGARPMSAKPTSASTSASTTSTVAGVKAPTSASTTPASKPSAPTTTSTSGAATSSSASITGTSPRNPSAGPGSGPTLPAATPPGTPSGVTTSVPPKATPVPAPGAPNAVSSASTSTATSPDARTTPRFGQATSPLTGTADRPGMPGVVNPPSASDVPGDRVSKATPPVPGAKPSTDPDKGSPSSN